MSRPTPAEMARVRRERAALLVEREALAGFSAAREQQMADLGIELRAIRRQAILRCRHCRRIASQRVVPPVAVRARPRRREGCGRTHRARAPGRGEPREGDAADDSGEEA